MSHQPIRSAFEPSATGVPRKPDSTSSYRQALQGLRRAFTECWPLAVLQGDGKCGTGYVLDHFFTRIGSDVTVVRLAKPVRSAESAMHKIIRSIGFDPAGLDFSDLNNVFLMFVSFQARHNQRTILCFEEAQNCGWWLLDVIHRLTNLKSRDSRGLTVLVSGQPTTDTTLNRSMLDAIDSRPGRNIFLASFSLAETREFLRWKLESPGVAEISQLFEFDAITLVHELTGGSTDAVSQLASLALQLAADDRAMPVTVALVNEAMLKLEAPLPEPQSVDQLQALVGYPKGRRGGRLMVRLGNGTLSEHSLDRGHVLIGRGKLCDVRIPSASVSRHHALVINSNYGAMLVDLESTNGTFVDGHRVNEHALVDRGVITMGDCRIDYIADGDEHGWIFDVHGANRAEPVDSASETQQLETLGKGHSLRRSANRGDRVIKGNINRKGEKIYHAPGTSKYDATKIDESKGERWFRTELEAEAAGWRAPATVRPRQGT